MYRPPAFREDSLERQHAFLREEPLGLLVTNGSDGLVADFAPFVLDAEPDALGTLRVHLARANPQLRALAEADECLVVFRGPEAYISPGWYPTKKATGKVVPTWNYATVHVWGRPRVVEDPAWLRAQIHALTEMMEGERPEPWSVDDAPDDYIASQIGGIVGVEIPILRIEGKWKVSQNQPVENRTGVVEGLRAEGKAAMANLVEERGASPR